jgi:hypothetical protein
MGRIGMRSIFESRKRPKSSKLRQEQTPEQEDALSGELSESEQQLRAVYTDCPDVVFRPFVIGGIRRALLVYIEGMSNIELMDQYILVPLMREAPDRPDEDAKKILEQRTPVSNVKEINTYASCIEQLSNGNPIVLVEGQPSALSFSLAKWDKRAIEEPSAEAVVRGPREGFTETLSVNVTMLRRKIRSPKLKMLKMQIGRYTQTEIAIVYIDGIVNPTLIDEVSNRLNRIDMDGVIESGYIEEMIEDNPSSIFPQIMNTERPDVAAASLLEGQAVILINGTPFALIAPVTIYSLFQSAEDYYQRYIYSTAIRWLRFIAVSISLLLPSMYVAVLSYHQELVPTSLFYSIAKSREEIPFPVLVEALIMEITFEALREAGVRLPKQVGAAVSIVGALVIGQAAVSAGIVSAPMVMVVAITGISSFMIPRYTAGFALRLIRFPIMLCAGALGLLGIMLAVMATIVHMCTLRSFGVPYLSPMGPIVGQDIKDVLIRAPWWKMDTRPHLSHERGNLNRQKPGQKPGPTRE